MDSKIHVYFHNESSGDSANPSEVTEQNGELKSSGSNAFEKSAIMTGIIQYGQKTLTEGTQVYADLTGSYQSQRNINGIISSIGTIYMMSKFPVGTIAGAFSMATQVANNIVSDIKANRESALLLKRSGNENINNSEVD